MLNLAHNTYQRQTLIMDTIAIGLLNAAVTLIVGTFAYGVYRKSKRDEKRRAASVILLEIEEAEQHLVKVSAESPFPETDEQVKLMPVASWNQYKHLFTANFDRNETDKISDFYSRCQEYDKAAAFVSEVTFEQNQQEQRINMQRILADYAREYNDKCEQPGADKDMFEQEYIKRRENFVRVYGNTASTHMYSYVPVKPYNDAKRALQGIEQSLSLTSVGTKFKNICRQRNIFNRVIDRVRSF